MDNVISFEQFKASVQGSPSVEQKSAPTSSGCEDAFEQNASGIKAFLDQHQVKYKIYPKPDKTIIQLAECPFNPTHGNSAFLVYPDGKVGFQCFHDSCQNYHYKDAVAKISGSQAAPELIDNALHVLYEINRSHAVVRLSGKVVVLNEEKDPLTGLTKVTFSSVGDFKNFYANRFIFVTGKNGITKREDASTKWLEWEKRREYHSVVFEPDRDIEGCYNLYQGLAVEPRAGDCSLMIQHIYEVIAAGNETIGDYVIAWLADIVQNPGGPLQGTSIALRGSQGCGKGILVNNFGKILGPYYLHLSSPDQLTGRFNDDQKSAILTFADEAIWGGEKAAEGKLKAMVTEPTLRIEPKGVNPFQITNHMRLILASNNDWIVPAGFQERRFLVLDVSDARCRDFEYFKAIQNQMDNGGLEAFLHYLLQVDLKGINLRDIPRTNALMDQMLETMTPFQKFWYDKLSSGEMLKLIYQKPYWNTADYGPYPGDWPNKVPVSNMWAEFVEYAKAMGIQWRGGERQMGKNLVQICSETRRVRIGQKNCRQYVYLLPDLERCRELFAEQLGMDPEWPPNEEDTEATTDQQ